MRKGMISLKEMDGGEPGMEILLIRHGQTQGNLEGRYVGRTDEPLLESAKEALRQSKWRDFTPDLVYCSPMLRCRQTAEILFFYRESCPISCETKVLYENDSDTNILVWDGFQETDFGQFEYLTYADLNGNPDYQAWIDSGGLTAFPGGESGQEFRLRCQNAFVRCVKDAKEKQAQKIAIVAHGGTIMSIMERYAVPKADFYSWQVKNAEGFLVRLEKMDSDGDCQLAPTGKNYESSLARILLE